jgi:hypothetical protein
LIITAVATEEKNEIANPVSLSSSRASALHLGMLSRKNNHAISPNMQKCRMTTHTANTLSLSPAISNRTVKTLGYKRRKVTPLKDVSGEQKETDGEDDTSPLPLTALEIDKCIVQNFDGIVDVDCDVTQIVRDSFDTSPAHTSTESEKDNPQMNNCLMLNSPLQIEKRNRLNSPTTPFKKNKRFRSQMPTEGGSVKSPTIRPGNEENEKKDLGDV